MTSALKLSVVWQDDDLIELVVSAVNPRFMGQTRVYATDSTIEEMADRLVGFPAAVIDTRRFEFASTTEGNHVSLDFRVVDGSGHALVVAAITDREENGESATVVVPVAASTIDGFVHALRLIATTRSGGAELEWPEA